MEYAGRRPHIGLAVRDECKARGLAVTCLLHVRGWSEEDSPPAARAGRVRSRSRVAFVTLGRFCQSHSPEFSAHSAFRIFGRFSGSGVASASSRVDLRAELVFDRCCGTSPHWTVTGWSFQLVAAHISCNRWTRGQSDGRSGPPLGTGPPGATRLGWRTAASSQASADDHNLHSRGRDCEPAHMFVPRRTLPRHDRCLGVVLRRRGRVGGRVARRSRLPPERYDEALSHRAGEPLWSCIGGGVADPGAAPWCVTVAMPNRVYRPADSS